MTWPECVFACVAAGVGLPVLGAAVVTVLVGWGPPAWWYRDPHPWEE